MPDTSVMTSMQATRPAGLVSVDGRAYPLKSARVEARAEGGVAFTTFTQSYDNPYAEPLEVLYTLPLPAGGAVTGYTVRLGQRVIRGEVQRREEAREAYRKALFEGRTAALLEQDRADTFTQKLGCLPPGETAEVEIEVIQALEFLPGDSQGPAQWEYRFPTVVGVRYEGAPGRVPDAGRLDVDRAGGEGTPVRLEAALLIADGLAGVVCPVSPGREVVCADHAGGVRVALGQAMKLDRDLVFRWQAAGEEVGVRAVEGKGLKGDDGRYLLLTLTPPAHVSKAMARDLTLLIDASGSMTGTPLARAKIVAEELLHSLDRGDRFEILAFAEQVQALTPGRMDATPRNIRKGLDQLAALQAGGGTEMVEAMVEALAQLRPESQRQVILITDGQIGFESQVINKVLHRVAAGVRLHAVAIGSAPNRTLTRGVARAGRGVEIMVGDDDDARKASRRLLQATVRPVLTEVSVTGPGLAALAPRRMQDILESRPLILLAEVAAAGGELEITGRLAGDSRPWSRKLPVGGQSGHETGAGAGSGMAGTTTLPLGALFGREAIEDRELLLAAASEASERKRIEREIEELGLRHRIASRRTSLVAISEDPTVDPRDPRRRERLAVEVPAEVSAEGVGLMPMASYTLYKTLPPQMDRRSMPMASAILSERYEGRGPEDDGEHEFEEFPQSDLSAEPLFKTQEADRLIRRRMGPLECEGRVLHHDGQLLVFEFEAPVDGLMLPADCEVWVFSSTGNSARARMLAAESSPPGPYSAGLTVRLALELEGGFHLTLHDAWVQWPAAEDSEFRIHLEFHVGAEWEE